MNRPGRRLERLLAALPDSPPEAAALVDELGASAILAEAKSFGLIPLLSHYLPQKLALAHEEELQGKFRDQHIQRGTAKAFRDLRAAGVEGLALKGPALAARLYPQAWLRPSTDVDVLIRPGEVPRAKEALRAAGWEFLLGPTGDPLDFGHDLMFLGPGRLLLELHFTASWHFQARFDVEALFARSRPQQLAGEPIRVLGAADDLVQSCVHAAGHVFEGVKWLFDLKLAARQPELQWSEVVRVAREAGVARVVGVALDEARRRVRADVPGEALEQLLPGVVRRTAARAVQWVPVSLVRTRSYAFDLLLPDRLSKQWLMRLAAPPIKRARRLARWVAGRR